MWKFNNLNRFIITLICISFFSIANAQQVYKSVDAQGNVVYSDQPSSNAQPVSLPPISVAPTPATVPLAPVSIPSPVSSPSNIVVYTQLDLISPLNDQTIWDNNGTVNVVVALSPPLGPGDMIQVIVDGKVAASSNTSPNFSLTGLERGTHVLQVQIINSKKKVVKVSNVVTFYLHKAIAACNSPIKTCINGDCQQELIYLANHTTCQQIFTNEILQAESRYQTCQENLCGQLAEYKKQHEAISQVIQTHVQAAMLALEDNIEQCKTTHCSELSDMRKKYFIAESNIYKFKVNQCERDHCKELKILNSKYQQMQQQLNG